MSGAMGYAGIRVPEHCPRQVPPSPERIPLKRLRIVVTACVALTIAGAGLSAAFAQDDGGDSDGPDVVRGGSQHNVGGPAAAPGRPR